MGRMCNMHGGNEKFMQNLSENLKGRDHVGKSGIDEGIHNINRCVKQ
jgi:hypothetical protein